MAKPDSSSKVGDSGGILSTGCVSDLNNTIVPLITVIIPIFNGDKSLELAIQSVLIQEGPAFEVALIDDGSSDTSPSICRRYVAADSRVRLISQEVNQGIAHTLNVGITSARGKYILILHQDCSLVGNDWLSRAVTCLCQQDVAGIAGRPVHDPGRMTMLEKVLWIARSHAVGTVGTPQATSPLALFSENKCDLYRRDDLISIDGFDESFRGGGGGEDQMLSLRFQEAGKRVVNSPDLTFELTLGSDGGLHSGLRKEFLYGRQMRLLLRRSRGKVVRRTTTGGLDPRLTNRALGVGWILTLALLVALYAYLKFEVLLLTATLPPSIRAIQLLVRGAAERHRYSLGVRGVLGVVALGFLMDISYTLGLIIPARSRAITKTEVGLHTVARNDAIVTNAAQDCYSANQR